MIPVAIHQVELLAQRAGTARVLLSALVRDGRAHVDQVHAPPPPGNTPHSACVECLTVRGWCAWLWQMVQTAGTVQVMCGEGLFLRPIGKRAAGALRPAPDTTTVTHATVQQPVVMIVEC